jgi:HPt (histidine-containing phosphotransfer) domain-containing protein
MTQQHDRTSQVGVNFPELLSRMDNDRDLVRELIEVFKKEFPSLLQMLRESAACKDAKRVEITSHTLTGMLSCLSATRAAELSRELEQRGRERKTSELIDVLRLLEDELARLVPELDDYIREMGL